MNHFQKTGNLCRKIDIFYQQGTQWHYACSTTWHKTCKAAVQSWADIHAEGDVKHLRGRFAK